MDQKPAFPQRAKDEPQPIIERYEPYDLQRFSPSEIIKAALQEGPIAATLCVAGIYDSYDGGILRAGQACPATSCKDNLYHGVFVMGYMNDEMGNPLYIIRNSWGPWWGADGFLYVEAGRNACQLESSLMNYTIFRLKMYSGQENNQNQQQQQQMGQKAQQGQQQQGQRGQQDLQDQQAQRRQQARLDSISALDDQPQGR